MKRMPNFTIGKLLHSKRNDQPMKWEKIFAKHTSDKGLISKIYKEDFPGGTVVKNLPANAGDTGSSPGQGTRTHMPWSN